MIALVDHHKIHNALLNFLQSSMVSLEGVLCVVTMSCLYAQINNVWCGSTFCEPKVLEIYRQVMFNTPNNFILSLHSSLHVYYMYSR